MMLTRVGIALCLGSFVFVWEAHANDLEELLLDALKGYVEEKAEEAGIDIPGQVKNASLVFVGATTPPPDVFEPLYATSTTSTPPPIATNSGAEQECYNRVQNKIAWDASGRNKSWSPNNIKNLCKGTTVASAPPTCFYNAMYRGTLWGKKNNQTMTWGLASKLCSGVNSASTPISCLKGKIAGFLSLTKAVNACASNANSTFVNPGFTVLTPTFVKPTIFTAGKLQEKECFSYIQGKIAWDAAGRNKTWAPNNIKRLCKKTTSKYSPGNCFSYALHKGSSWGRKSNHKMDWSKAIDLCEGANNANKVTSCFKSAIAAGKSLDNSIKQCDS